MLNRRQAITATAAGVFFQKNLPASAQDQEQIPDNTSDASRALIFYEYIEKPGDEQQSSGGLQGFKLPRSFVFPKDTLKDDKGNDRENQIFGVDISHHNGPNIRFDLMRSQGISFIYMKAGQGGGKDPRFKANWSAVGSLKGTRKLYRGAYFFLSSQRGGDEQGKLFSKIMGPLSTSDLSPVIDLEWDVVPGVRDQWQGTSAKTIIDQTIACLEAVKAATNRSPILYTAGSWLNERIGNPSQISRLAPYKIWLADYSKSALGIEAPKVPSGLSHKLWQFTDRAQISNGYDDSIDANVYHGSDEEFKSDFGVIDI